MLTRVYKKKKKKCFLVRYRTNNSFNGFATQNLTKRDRQKKELQNSWNEQINWTNNRGRGRARCKLNGSVKRDSTQKLCPIPRTSKKLCVHFARWKKCRKNLPLSSVSNTFTKNNGVVCVRTLETHYQRKGWYYFSNIYDTTYLENDRS